jgi:hypothetical protein
MRLFLIQNYQLNKNDIPEHVINRIEQVLRLVKRYSNANYFLIEDSPSKSKIDLVMKKMQEFSPFEFTFFNSSGKKVKGLSNIGKPWNPHSDVLLTKSVPFNVLQELICGIPRKYAFHNSTFLIDQINWFDDSKTEVYPYGKLTDDAFQLDPQSYLSNCIIYRNDWWTPKRKATLTAIFEYPDFSETDTNELENFEKKYAETFAILGKPKTKKFVVCPSDNEIESIAILKENLNKIIYPKNLEKEIIRKEKLFELPDESERVEMDSENSRKKILIKYFKDFGYSYATSLYSNGSYCLVKRTKNNNQIKLFFDAGTYSQTMLCEAIIDYPFGEFSLSVPLYTPTRELGSFSISTPDLLDMVIHNYSKSIKVWETTRFETIDNVIGKSPKWFVYQ